MFNQKKQTIGIKETLFLIPKSKDPLSPLSEALMNSLDGIKQRRQQNDKFIPEIIIELHFAKEDLLESYTIDYISVSDNGIGFGKDNEERLLALGDRSKGLNNRGTGKAQIFHRFKKIAITSVFEEGNEFLQKEITYDINDNYSSNQKQLVDDVVLKTTVKMKEYCGEKEELDFWLKFKFHPGDLKKEIIKHLFLRLFLEKGTNMSIKLGIFEQDTVLFETMITGKDIPDPEKTEKATIFSVKCIPGNTLTWENVEQHDLEIRRFKMPTDDATGNEIYLCSKSILVKPFQLPLLRKNTNYSGYYYLTSISGDILDNPSNVSQAVDDFTFPSRKRVEQDIENGDMLYPDNTFIFREDLNKSLSASLERVYSDVKDLKDEQSRLVLEIAKKFGISEETVRTTNVNINDSREDITKKLFATQAKTFAKRSIEIQKSYDEIIKIETASKNPLNEDYEEKMGEATQKLLSLIPEQNKDELARYIIRRDMIVKILQLILNNKSAQQMIWEKKKESGEKVREDREGLIHDLIFQRRHNTACTNDLWILNEEYVHFSGCSDMSIEQLEVNGEKLLKDDIDIAEALTKTGLQIGNRLEKRPDIFLFPEEGKCILIEFKAPDVDVSKHLDQIAKYAKLIANFARNKITQFYGYFFGENINNFDIPDRYHLAPYGNYWVYSSEPIRSIETQSPIADLYQEIIPLSTVANRAEIRNRSFANKLGIPYMNS